MVYKWLESVRLAVWGAPCVLCGLPAGREIDLCRGCEADLPVLGAACPLCALPMPSVACSQGHVCGRCLRLAPPQDAAYAGFVYAFPIRQLVTGFKYERRLDQGRVLAELFMARLAASSPRRPDVLIPVPLHATRLRERGFNQSLELARVLSRDMGVPTAPDRVQRIRATSAQAGLSLAQRRRNMRGVFVAKADVSGAHVAVVDDVMTTGSTTGEMVRSLKAAGAARVDLWVLARALHGVSGAVP